VSAESSDVEAYAKKHIHFISTCPRSLRYLPFESSGHLRVLDVGCGDGINVYHISRKRPDWQVTALDTSYERIRRVRELNLGVDCVVGDATKLDFADCSFDAVISTQVIEHCSDDLLFMSEISRVLVPDGLAVVTSVARLKGAWYFYKNEFGKRVLDPTHVREYASAEEFVMLFERFFKVTHTHESMPKFSVLHFLIRLLRRQSKHDPLALDRSNLLKAFAAIKVPIPRYRVVELVGRRKN